MGRAYAYTPDPPTPAEVARVRADRNADYRDVRIRSVGLTITGTGTASTVVYLVTAVVTEPVADVFEERVREAYRDVYADDGSFTCARRRVVCDHVTDAVIAYEYDVVCTQHGVDLVSAVAHFELFILQLV